MTRSGEVLTAFLSTAAESAWLVAPFMIAATTKRALDAIPPYVARVTVVTRWRPKDVAAGVSDLGVLDVVASRPGATLLIHPNLHAKVYRADARSLVGSANITDKALGWASESNLEILAPCHEHELIEEFMTELLKETYEATSEIRDTISLFVPQAVPMERQKKPWLPECASPGELWNVHTGTGLADVLSSAVTAGQADLKALDIATGLGSEDFYRIVTERFAEMQLVQQILGKMGASVTDDHGIELLKRVIPGEYIPYSDARKAWDIFKRWLQVFGGGGFRSKSAGEVIVRERVL